jgi:hypothetical protein
VLVAGSAFFNHDDGVAIGMKHLQAAILRQIPISERTGWSVTTIHHIRPYWKMRNTL